MQQVKQAVDGLRVDIRRRGGVAHTRDGDPLLELVPVIERVAQRDRPVGVGRARR